MGQDFYSHSLTQSPINSLTLSGYFETEFALTLTPPSFLIASRRRLSFQSCLDCSSDPVSTPKKRKIFLVKYLKKSELYKKGVRKIIIFRCGELLNPKLAADYNISNR